MLERGSLAVNALQRSCWIRFGSKFLREESQNSRRLLKNSEKQIPHRLKPIRNDKNKGLKWHD